MPVMRVNENRFGQVVCIFLQYFALNILLIHRLVTFLIYNRRNMTKNEMFGRSGRNEPKLGQKNTI